jgi:hypothetical protein
LTNFYMNMLINLKRKVFLCCILFFCNLAFAGIVEQVQFEAQPAVYLKNGEINGCGYRILGSNFSSNKSAKSYGIDFSFNAYSEGVGIVKGGLREFKVENANDIKPLQVLKIQNLWIKTKDSKATNPIGNIFSKNINPPNYILYEADVSIVFNLIFSVFGSNEIMVGYRLDGEDIDRIFNGKVKLMDSEVKQIKDCMAELIKNSKK